LTVNAPPAGPTIATQPADRAAIAGQPVTFAVTARGALPLAYQWQKNGLDIPGASASALTIPAAITPDCGASFTVVVASSAGSVTSARATLTVTPAAGAPIILTNPARARVLSNQQASFSVTASSPSPMRYQWQKGPHTGVMMDIPRATEATYTTPAAAPADSGSIFRCVVSNSSGNATSAGEMLLVTAARTP
jgi:hypothetical protein